MLINLKNNLHWLIYGAGLFAYFIMLAQTTLTLSVMWLLFVLYLWLTVSIVTNFDSCCTVVAVLSGLTVSENIFLLSGTHAVLTIVNIITCNIVDDIFTSMFMVVSIVSGLV